MTQSNTQPQYPDVKTLRTAFPVTNYCAYLNHAATAPLPDPVRGDMSEFIADRGVCFERQQRYERLSDDLCAVLARLINAAPEEIALVQNTSTGLNIIANALPLETGDNVIFCDMERRWHRGCQGVEDAVLSPAQDAVVWPGHSDVGDEGGSLVQHAGVGGRDVRMRTEDYACPPVAVPAHGDFLA